MAELPIGNSYILCVTGSRDYDDAAAVEEALDTVVNLCGPPSILLHGDAKGADAIAKRWVLRRFGPEREYAVPALWDQLGKKAGMVRNREMCDMMMSRDVVVGFPLPQSIGTHGMLRICRERGDLTVIEIEKPT